MYPVEIQVKDTKRIVLLFICVELNVEKACGPDVIPIRVMKYAAEEIAPTVS